MQLSTPCWEWPGRRTKAGYGQISIRTEDLKHSCVYAHRDMWEQCFGPIPDGVEVLHKCDNPPCRNIEHLFLGTQKDNMADAAMKGRIRNQNMRATHCKRGHPFDAQNTGRDWRGNRFCRTCARLLQKNYRQRLRKKHER